MAERPYVVLSCGVSMDGFLDDRTPARLLLSNDADLDRVDAVRASCDAILVGAATVRSDDPRLLVRSPERRETRVRRGIPPSPTKVTVTRRGALDPAGRFFTTGADVAKLVYCPVDGLGDTRTRLGTRAEVVAPGGRRDVGFDAVLDDLGGRGVRRLMVEGGGDVLTQFLAGGLADELRLAVAPVFVGDTGARRFVGDAVFPWTREHRARLAHVEQLGDVAVLHYALSDRCRRD